jgi:hypothetical protein
MSEPFDAEPDPEPLDPGPPLADESDRVVPAAGAHPPTTMKLAATKSAILM